MKKIVIGLLAMYLFLSQKTDAFADICTPIISPAGQIEPGSEITVSFDLSSQSDLSGYVIRGYNTGALLQSPYDLSNQDIDLLAKTISARHTVQGSINVWLDRNGANVCGNETTLNVSSIEPSCSPNVMTIVGLDSAGNEITDYTFNNPTLRVRFDSTLTQNFPSASRLRDVNGLVLKNSDNTARNGGNPIATLGYNASEQATLNNGYVDFPNPGVGNYAITVGFYTPRGTGAGAISVYDYTGTDVSGCRQAFSVSEDGDNAPPSTIGSSNYDICEQIPDKGAASVAYQSCRTCRDKVPQGIWTAVGCIQVDAKSIVAQVVQIGLGLAGGIALLMIVAAGFLFSTSQNDPKRVTEARDLMTSAIIGLLFIIFSVTLLQFVGVTILRIPGFGG